MILQYYKTDDFQLTIQAMGISLYDWTKAIFEAKLFADDARVISFTSEGNSKAWRNYAAVSAAKVTLEAITTKHCIRVCSLWNSSKLHSSRSDRYRFFTNDSRK